MKKTILATLAVCGFLSTPAAASQPVSGERTTCTFDGSMTTCAHTTDIVGPISCFTDTAYPILWANVESRLQVKRYVGDVRVRGNEWDSLKPGSVAVSASPVTSRVWTWSESGCFRASENG